MNRSTEELLKTELLEIRRRDAEKTNALGMIHRLTELLPQKLGVRQTSEHLVRIIIEETDFENCSIALWNPLEKCLSFVAAFGLPDLLEEDVHVSYQRKLKFMSNQEVASRVFTTGEAVFIEDTEDAPIPNKMNAAIHPRCLLCLPLLDQGILNISASQPRRITSQIKRNWILLGNIIGQLILTASLNERLCDTNQHLQHEVDEKTRSIEEKNRALAATNRFLEKIIDQSPEGICLLDAKGMITRVNRRMETFQGTQASKVLGCSPAVFFHEPKIFQTLFDEVTDHDQCRLSDVFLLASEGQPHPADLFLTKLTDVNGRVEGYLLVIYDMAEKKAFSEHLLRTEKLAAMGTMAGGVGHDFNNMLMRILGNTQLLLLQLTDEPVRKRLQNIEMAVDEAAQSLRRLQTFAGRDKEDQSCLCAVDVNEIIQDVVELTRPRWKNVLEKHGHTIELRTELEPSCSALIRPSELREVVTNLILNAVDAMPKGGTLTLASKCNEQAVVIEVSDSGMGMSDEAQRKIFDPFYTTKGVGNSGLGLSVSWNIVNRCNGDIQVNSQVGKGSTFRIILPRTESRQETPSQEKSDPEREGQRVLLVDDDQEILRLLRDMIRMDGHKVVATHDGQKALDLIDSEDFDLVMTDMGMPVVSGWEIARRVKARNPRVPVILITGWGTQYEEEDLSRQGIDLVLSKPVGYEKLHEILQKLL